MDNQRAWAFVDYENTGSLEGLKYNSYERILVFCGPKNSKINIGKAALSDFLSIEIIKINTSSNNNLDFHIAYYLGKFSDVADKNISFHIITKDNGFNGIISHIKKTGRNCKKVANKTTQKSKSLPPKLSSDTDIVVQKLKSMDGRKRPKNREKLVNWIGSQFSEIPVPENVLKKLLSKKLILLSDNKTAYHLKIII